MIHGRRLGLLGGTLDPIHYGHLDAAEAARDALRLDEVRVIPSYDPPHRPDDPVASVYHRFALVALAVDGRPRLRASDAELRHSGPSYTIDTLRALAAEGWRPDELFFIIGADAFADLATWRAFPAVLDAAHFVLCARPGVSLDVALERVPAVRERLITVTGDNVAADRSDGVMPARDAERPQTSVFLVDAPTRDVSSTAVRARLAAGLPVDDLVPGSVARHILAHHLYGAVDHLHGQDEHGR